ncbi:MAG: M12 family metallopeptidase, partial [Rhodothermaceae bacterium]
TEDQMVNFLIGDQNVEFYKQGDKYYFYDDVVYSLEEIKALQQKHNNLKKTKGCYKNSLATRWPANVVYYKIEDSELTSVVMEAISEYESKTNLKFIPKRDEVDKYIKFVQGSTAGAGSTGSIGMALSGYNHITISIIKTKHVLHEIGHALGLYHEHQRYDRDNYLIFDEAKKNELISVMGSSWWKNNMGIKHGESISGSLDYKSIMIYPSSFMVNKISYKKVFTKLDGRSVSSTFHLSAQDVATINKMYPKVELSLKIDNKVNLIIDKANSLPGDVKYEVYRDGDVKTTLPDNVFTPVNLPVREYPYNPPTYSGLKIGGLAPLYGTYKLRVKNKWGDYSPKTDSEYWPVSTTGSGSEF